MRKLIFVLFVLSLTSSTLFAFDKPQTLKSTVHVMAVDENGDMAGVCNGVVLKNADHYATVLTAGHCLIPGDYQYYVENQKAYFSFKSEKYDLAFIYVTNRLDNKESAKLSDRSIQFNEAIYFVGDVVGEQVDRMGRVISTIFDDISTLSVRRGCSGGGVWNDSGELVGILTTGYFLNDRITYSNLAGSESMSHIRSFLYNELGDWRYGDY